MILIFILILDVGSFKVVNIQFWYINKYIAAANTETRFSMFRYDSA